MDFFNKKTFMQAQIAMKLDEYFYEKDAQTYFETMPHIGLFDSQVSNVNTYIEAFENKERTPVFRNLLNLIREENAGYKEKLDAGSKSTIIKKLFRITAYLIRQMEKYDKLF